MLFRSTALAFISAAHACVPTILYCVIHIVVHYDYIMNYDRSIKFSTKYHLKCMCIVLASLQYGKCPPSSLSHLAKRYHLLSHYVRCSVVWKEIQNLIMQ